MSFTLSARLDDEIQEPLNFLAKRMRRSKSFLMGDALKRYITEKMEEIEDERDAEKALALMNNPSPIRYTTDEILKRIEAKASNEQ